MLWMGCILVISDSLAAPLYDAELVGTAAHELAHSYFMDEMIRAQRDKDELSMRAVELKCDAVAMMTLKLLGERPELLVRGIKRITELTKKAGFGVQMHGRSHPTVVERMQFAELFLRQCCGNYNSQRGIMLIECAPHKEPPLGWIGTRPSGPFFRGNIGRGGPAAIPSIKAASFL
jgi:hypothetical protein